MSGPTPSTWLGLTLVLGGALTAVCASLPADAQAGPVDDLAAGAPTLGGWANLTRRQTEPAPGQSVLLTASYVARAENGSLGNVRARFILDGATLGEAGPVTCSTAGGNQTSPCANPDAVLRLSWTATAGEHTLRVLLDPGAAIPEADETNNEGTIAFRVQDPPPDRQDVTAIAGSLAGWTRLTQRQTAPAPGQSATFSARLDATSDNDSVAGVRVRFYLDDAPLADAGPLTCNRPSGATGFAAYACPDAAASVPWTATAGNHTLRVVVDPDGLLNETDETNNAATLAFVVEPAPPDRQDLAALLATVGGWSNRTQRQVHPAPGQAVTLSIAYEARSDNASVAGVRARFLVDGSLAGEAGPVTCERPASIAAFLPYPCAAALSTGWTATPGTHVLTALLDPAGALNETDEANNAVNLTFLVEDPPPDRQDVVPANLSVEGWPRLTQRQTGAAPGQRVGLTVRVFAISDNASVEGVTARFLVDNATVGDAGPIPCRWPAPKLGYVSYVCEGVLGVNWTATAGNHSLRVVLDPDRRLNETNEQNNEATLSFAVEHPPPDRQDLVAERARWDEGWTRQTLMQTNPSPGQKLSLSVAASALSDAAKVAGVRASFYMDGWWIGDVGPTTCDKPTGLGYQAYPCLDGPPSRVTWTALKGNHTLRVVLDPSNLLGEASETNNEASLTFTVEDPPLANDLVGVALSHVGQSKKATRQTAPAPGDPLSFSVVFGARSEATSIDGVKVRLFIDGSQIGESVVHRCAVSRPYGRDPMDECTAPAIRWNAVLGTHVVRAVIDPDGVVREMNETNNEVLLPLVVEEPPSDRLDVVAGAVRLGEFPRLTTRQVGPAPNQDVKVILDWSARGEKTIPPFSARLLVDGSGVKDLPTLCVGRKDDTTQPCERIEFPWTAQPGQHRLKIILDPEDKLRELNRENNAAELVVDVEKPPSDRQNFAVGRVDATWPQPRPGAIHPDPRQIVDVSAELAVDGDAAFAPPIAIRFLVDNVTVASIPSTAGCACDALENGRTGTPRVHLVRWSWTVDAPGLHQLRVEVDAEKVLDETSETDNAWQGDLALARLPQPAIATVPFGLTVTADARGSSGGEGGPVSFEWEWGDGERSAGPTATHSYAKPGVYSIRLLVRDAAGNADVRDVRVYVQPDEAPDTPGLRSRELERHYPPPVAQVGSLPSVLDQPTEIAVGGPPGGTYSVFVDTPNGTPLVAGVPVGQPLVVDPAAFANGNHDLIVVVADEVAADRVRVPVAFFTQEQFLKPVLSTSAVGWDEPLRLAVNAFHPSGSPGSLEAVVTGPDGEERRFALVEESPGVFVATVSARTTGTHAVRIESDAPTTASVPVSVTFEVLTPGPLRENAERLATWIPLGLAAVLVGGATLRRTWMFATESSWCRDCGRVRRATPGRLQWDRLRWLSAILTVAGIAYALRAPVRCDRCKARGRLVPTDASVGAAGVIRIVLHTLLAVGLAVGVALLAAALLDVATPLDASVVEALRLGLALSSGAAVIAIGLLESAQGAAAWVRRRRGRRTLDALNACLAGLPPGHPDVKSVARQAGLATADDVEKLARLLAEARAIADTLRAGPEDEPQP